jgi:hypothetical protein
MLAQATIACILDIAQSWQPQKHLWQVLLFVDSNDGVFHPEVLGFLDFLHRQLFWKLESTVFRKVYLFSVCGQS